MFFCVVVIKKYNIKYHIFMFGFWILYFYTLLREGIRPVSARTIVYKISVDFERWYHHLEWR